MILIVGGDSVEAIWQRFGIDGAQTIEHWSGRRPRDLQRSLSKDTEAVVVMLDRISYALAREIRTCAGRRGIPIVFMGRKWVSRSGCRAGLPTARYQTEIQTKESLI